MYNTKLYFHFVGIGGVGMSGIAEILIDLGFRISGSDLKCGDSCKRLQRLGALIKEGHAAQNLPEDCSLVVYSSAVQQDNPELVEAKRRGLPIVRRAEVLAELMRLKYGVAVAGSHGKTSTTEMVGNVLEEGELDPTVIIGGRVKSKGTGSRFGHGNYLVAESDESDRSFLLLKPTIAIVTNIDAEHLTAYQSISDLEQSFAQFVNATPFYGLAILCIDDQRVRSLAVNYEGRKVCYGFSLDADLRAENIEFDKWSTSYDVIFHSEKIAHVKLHLPGKHFVLNSLAAFATGLEFGVPVQKIVTALEKVQGVQRRLEKIGVESGVTVISDYAHHPTEIKASLKALREGWGSDVRKIHVVFEPHRYSRLRDCFIEFIDAFTDCDRLIVTDVYAAGEEPLEGVSAESLCSAISRPLQRHYIPHFQGVMPVLKEDLSAGDIVVCMGAGAVGAYAYDVLEMLKLKDRAA
jgi:UDP-N-acetylmuramate--alanine ligase